MKHIGIPCTAVRSLLSKTIAVWVRGASDLECSCVQELESSWI